MSGELQQKTDRIAAKARIVTERYAIVAAQRDQLLKQVADLQREIQTLRREIARRDQQAEYLRAAMTFAPTRDDTARVRTLLASLVREIDTCIAQLKE